MSGADPPRRGTALGWAVPLIWAVFAAILVAGGYLALRACGTVLPWGMDMCDAPPPPDPAEDAAEARRALVRERDALLRQANLAPSCRIAAVQPPPPPAPDPEPDPVMADCQPAATAETVILLDVSGSMRAAYATPKALEDRLDELTRRYQAAEARGAVFDMAQLALQVQAAESAILAVRGQSRIDVAKQALSGLVERAPAGTEFNLMTFSECRRAPVREGVFPADPPEAFIRRVRQIGLRGGTALAEAIDALPAATRRGRSAADPVNIVILSDGRDSCSGDPCAAARRLRAAMPHAHVSVISVAAAAAANACVAEGTGGDFYQADDIDELNQRIRQATGQLSVEECRAAGRLPGSATEGSE